MEYTIKNQTKTEMNNAIICYIPVIHSGYISFFKDYPEAHLYVLGKSLLDDFPYIQRDVRALSPKEAVAWISAQRLFSSVSIVEKKDLKHVAQAYEQFILPDEDISIGVWDTMKDHVLSAELILHNIRLRWDMSAVIKNQKPSEISEVSFSEEHRKFMKMAEGLRPRSPDWWRQIGAVVVKDGEVILQGYNEHIPTEHSLGIEGDPRTPFNAGERFDLSCAHHGELNVITQAARRKDVSTKECDIYVTTFPCPTCAWAIAKAGFKTVYFRDGYSRLEADKVFARFGVKLVKVDMG